MTVSPAVMVSGPYIADGSNKSWSFGFKVKSASDLKVIVTSANGLNPVEYLTNYAVDATSLNRDAGGIVTFPQTGAPLSAGKRVWIASRVPYQQGTSLTSQGAYNPAQVMGALDDLAIQIKQLAADTARAPKFMYGRSGSRILEAPATGRTLVYDNDGNFVNGLGTAEISTGISQAQAAAAAAQASANLALGYQNAVQLLADTIFDATSLSNSFLPDVIRFSGDGVTATFSDAKLVGVDERATDVYLSGVRQQQDTYSVNSVAGSITFDEAPMSGASNIELKITKAISISYDISVPPEDVTYLEILPALPSTGNFEGRFVYLTSDDLLYTYDGTEWNGAVSSGGGGGGSLPDGFTAIQILDDLPASGNFEGRYVHLTADGKLYGYASGGFYTVGGGSVGGGGGSSTLTYIQVVDDFPLADNSEGRAVYLTADGKIYIFVEGDWAAVSGGIGGGGGGIPDGTTFIEILDTLPSVGNFEGRTVYLSTDGKLYTYTDGAWKTIIDGSDVNFPAGFTGIQIVAALPVTDNYDGRTVYLTTDGKLYRWTGSAWDRSTAAADIAGQITATQITDGAITTPKLAAGAVTALNITAGAITTDALAVGAVNAAKIAAGAITSTKLASGSVTADAILAGAVTAAKIAVTQLSAISGVLGSVNIQSAILGSLQVDTINLAGNAVTVQAGAETDGGLTIDASFSVVQSITVSWGATSPVFVWCQFKASNTDELMIDIRSGGVSLLGGGRVFNPSVNNFNHYIDMFPSGAVSGQALTFWLKRTSGGSTTIRARKLVALIAKR